MARITPKLRAATRAFLSARVGPGKISPLEFFIAALIPTAGSIPFEEDPERAFVTDCSRVAESLLKVALTDTGMDEMVGSPTKENIEEVQKTLHMLLCSFSVDAQFSPDLQAVADETLQAYNSTIGRGRFFEPPAEEARPVQPKNIMSEKTRRFLGSEIPLNEQATEEISPLQLLLRAAIPAQSSAPGDGSKLQKLTDTTVSLLRIALGDTHSKTLLGDPGIQDKVNVETFSRLLNAIIPDSVNFEHALPTDMDVPSIMGLMQMLHGLHVMGRTSERQSG